MEPNKNTSVFLRDTCKLGQVVKIQGGYSFQSSAFTNRGIPIIRISNIDNDQIDLKNSVVFYEEIRNLDENFIAKDGDLLIAMSGATTGKAGVYKNTNLAYINQRVGKFVVTKSDKVIYKYLSYWVSSNHFTKQLSKYLASGAQPNISPKNIEDMDIVLPDTKTQEKIIRTLDAISNNISNLEALVSKQESIKKTTVNLLLTSKPHWTEYKIKEKFKVTRGLVLSTNQMSKSQNGVFQYPVYSSQTQNNGLIGFYNNFLYQDAITWTTDGANAGFVRFRPGKFYCTNVCGVLLSDEGYANTCVATMLGNVSKKYVSYVGNPKLMNNVMAEIPLLFPSVQEQQYISDKIQKLDQQLEHLRSELDKYHNIKKGLMDYFFG